MAMGPQMFNKQMIKNYKFFRLEGNRLLSFRCWPCNSPLQPSSLAYFGFYCLTPTVTQCFSCLGCIGNWEVGDDPFNRHTTMSPNCPFIKKPKDVNVALDSFKRQKVINEVDIYRRKMEEFFTLEKNRFLSFTNFRIYDPKKVQVWYGLAEDGFLGVNRCTVECFACHERLSLRERSKVVEIHDKIFNNCPFLLNLPTSNKKMTFREKEEAVQYFKREEVSEDIDIPSYEENLTVITERNYMENHMPSP